MGYEASLFLEKPNDEFICSICLGVYDDPVSDECGHVFCSACLEGWLKRKNSCPMSSLPCSIAKIRKAPLPLRNLIGALQILCVECKKNYVSLDRYEDGCQDCYVRRLTNRTAAKDSFARGARQTQAQAQAQAQTSDNIWQSDWVKWAGIVGVATAGLLVLNSSMKHKSRDKK